MLMLAASRYVVDWGRVGIGSPLKAVNNWARRMREKMHVFPLRAGKFPCQQTTSNAAFLKDDNKRAVCSGGDPWEADPTPRAWRVG